MTVEVAPDAGATVVWGVVRHLGWEETTEDEHRALEAELRAALDAAVRAYAVGSATSADPLRAALDATNAVARERSFASAIVSALHRGRLLAAGSGRMGVWVARRGVWTEALAPRVFRFTPEARGRSQPLTASLGLGPDAGRYATCEVAVAPGDLVLVGLDTEIGRETLPEIPRGPDLDAVLRHVAERNFEPPGALAVLRVA